MRKRYLMATMSAFMALSPLPVSAIQNESTIIGDGGQYITSVHDDFGNLFEIAQDSSMEMTNIVITVQDGNGIATMPEKIVNIISERDIRAANGLEEDPRNAVIVSVKSPNPCRIVIPLKENGWNGSTLLAAYNGKVTQPVVYSAAVNGNLVFDVPGNGSGVILSITHGFTDIAQDYVHANAVRFASARGIINGTEDGRFDPDGILKRGMMARILWNMESQPAASGSALDVPKTSYYYRPVQWAVANGIISGYSPYRFGGEDPLSREQFATMLWRLSGSPQTMENLAFWPDAASVAPYAHDAMNWALEQGIITGSNGWLKPQDTCTRIQAALMIQRMIEAQLKG